MSSETAYQATDVIKKVLGGCVLLHIVGPLSYLAVMG